MVIDLYINSSENNRVNKVLSGKFEMSGTLRGETNVVNPEILIEHTNPTGYNYAYIPEFNRYYFINEFTAVRNGLWRVRLAVDVLETYKTQIKQMPAIIDKQQNKGNSNLYLNDGSYVIDSRSYNTILNFSGGFNDGGEFILITAGG
ncbi:MAG: hypothetical protein VZS12_09215 [Ruminococcus bromii]|nr:hypothetical protein [Ruminococcus bromii]